MDMTSMTVVLEERAQATPAAIGYTFRSEGALFQPDGLPGQVDLTYGELRDRVAGVADVFAATGPPGTTALLLYPGGFDFVTALLACFAVGWVPVPVSPPFRDPESSRATLAEVRRRSGARVVAASLPLWEVSRHAFPDDLEVVLTDGLPPSTSAPRVEPGRDDVAFIQFTSGSTGDPKGVTVTHANVLDHAATVGERLGADRAGPFVTWMPHFHDGGLIQGVLQPLCSGARSVLLAPESFLARPIRWLQAVSDTRAVLTGGPNFGYELCVRRTTPADRAGLDLTSWTVAPNAGEPIRTETLERFTDVFSEHGFRPGTHAPAYGLAEATLLVSMHAEPTPPPVLALDLAALGEGRAEPPAGDEAASVRVVGCGRPFTGVEVTIVDPVTHEACPDGVVGEIWVAGPTVTDGYWGDAEATAATFAGRVGGAGPPHLRTGDLGFLSDGHIFVTGRSKDVLIIRGRNLHPQDVEVVAERAHPALRAGCAAAFGVEGPDGEERIGLLMEVADGTDDLAFVTGAVRKAVAAFVGVQPARVVLVGKGTIPKTSSGKIRRRASRDAVRDGTVAPLASWPEG